jgi:hypothetical protein
VVDAEIAWISTLRIAAVFRHRRSARIRSHGHVVTDEADDPISLAVASVREPVLAMRVGASKYGRSGRKPGAGGMPGGVSSFRQSGSAGPDFSSSPPPTGDTQRFWGDPRRLIFVICVTAVGASILEMPLGRIDFERLVGRDGATQIATPHETVMTESKRAHPALGITAGKAAAALSPALNLSQPRQRDQRVRRRGRYLRSLRAVSTSPARSAWIASSILTAGTTPSLLRASESAP